MLIPDNIRPENSVYYNGGKVLEVMLSEKRLGIGDLYLRMREKMDISMATLTLSLDWLYLLGCLEVKDGEVVLCL
jgi:hypothetical protein